MVYRYCFDSTTDWQEKAERKVYANILKAIIKYRGKTKALKEDGTEFNINGVQDDELTPANGVYIFSENPPNSSNVKTNKGRTSSIIRFREDVNGQVWACIRESYNADVVIARNSINTALANQLGAERISINGKDFYKIKNFPFDFSSEIDKYNWEYDTYNTPEWAEQIQE